MTFSELRRQATAGETCLIDTVIGMVEGEIREKTLIKIAEFIKSNPPPEREITHFDREAYPKWFTKLNDHIKPPKKDEPQGK